MTSPLPRRASRLASIAAPAALFGLALAVRALPWRTVLDPGQVIPFGSDALYHLRRIHFAAAKFPASLDFDPYIHFPEGGWPIWTPVFDWVLAALLGALGPGVELERAAMWVPPLLGALTVLAVLQVARRHLGPGAAWIAAFTLALLSGHFWYSQIGFLDHHAAVALCAVSVLGAGLALVREPGRAGAPLGLGITSAAALLVWPGALLHTALVAAACGLEALRAPDRETARALAQALAGAHAIAAALVLPLALVAQHPQWGAFSPLVLGGFQPLWLAGLALLGWGAALLWGREWAGATAARRARSAGWLGLALLGAGLLAVPGLADGAAEAWRWLARREAFQAQVAESLPLLSEAGGLGLRVAAVRLSLFVFALPLVWIWLARSTEPEGAPLRVLLCWSLGLAVATLAQRRFFNSFSLAVAVLLGWTWMAAWRARPASWRRSRWAGAAVTTGLALLWLASMAPSLASFAPHLENEGRALAGRPLQVGARRLEQRLLLETALWMRGSTPATSGWLDPDARPEYGVLSPWDAGHALEYVARRPAVVDNFGDDLGPGALERAAGYFRSAEPGALEIADALGVRYVLVGTRFGFGPPAPGRQSMYRALRERDGSQGAESDEPALTRHRLVYESPSLDGPDGPPRYKVYEVVAGASLRGRAAPGAVVQLALPLRTNRGRRLVHYSETRADAAGSYRFRVPYSSAAGGADSVGAEGGYWLRCGDEMVEIAVDEPSVRQGLPVSGPPLCHP